MLKVQELREIIRLIDQSSISEFTFENNGTMVKIKKPIGEHTTKKQEISVEEVHIEEKQKETPDVTPRITKQTEEKSVETEVVEEDESIVEIVAPMVGTFYRKPSPESDPYVKVGDSIEEETVVCIVEAMKLFNEIEAETTGEIVDILVDDGELVEYGQPLFKVKTK